MHGGTSVLSLVDPVSDLIRPGVAGIVAREGGLREGQQLGRAMFPHYLSHADYIKCEPSAPFALIHTSLFSVRPFDRVFSPSFYSPTYRPLASSTMPLHANQSQAFTSDGATGYDAADFSLLTDLHDFFGVEIFDGPSHARSLQPLGRIRNFQ